MLCLSTIQFGLGHILSAQRFRMAGGYGFKQLCPGDASWLGLQKEVILRGTEGATKGPGTPVLGHVVSWLGVTSKTQI
jgi:hypothetical protein